MKEFISELRKRISREKDAGRRCELLNELADLLKESGRFEEAINEYYEGWKLLCGR